MGRLEIAMTYDSLVQVWCDVGFDSAPSSSRAAVWWMGRINCGGGVDGIPSLTIKRFYHVLAFRHNPEFAEFSDRIFLTQLKRNDP